MAVAVVAAMTGVLVFQGIAGGPEPREKQAAVNKRGPVRSDVRKAALQVTEDGTRAVLPQRDTPR